MSKVLIVKIANNDTNANRQYHAIILPKPILLQSSKIDLTSNTAAQSLYNAILATANNENADINPIVE